MEKTIEQLKRTGELPSDYEQCGSCGFDHAYEPVESRKAHMQLTVKRLASDLMRKYGTR